MPRLLREDEQPLDAIDIRKILLNCNNRRLKAYLLTLASGLMRAVEATAIRLKDIDFAVSPTRIHIRPEYAKTRMARDIYISDEKKVAPDKWEFIYNTNKRRAWQAPEGSGVPVGSEYHWYILAHQNVRKTGC
jgi:integrase